MLSPAQAVFSAYLAALARLRVALATCLACVALHAVALAQWTTPQVIAPRVQYRTFVSTAASAVVSYHVWTPPAYDTEPTRRFPVLYWLHGSGSPTAAIAPFSSWFDSAIAQGLIPPMLVVFPNGMGASMWCNSKSGAVPMETVVIHELIPEVDARLRTIPTRAGRLVEGFSMGGQGAGRFAFKYPQLFVAASLLGAGPLQLDFLDEPPCSTTPLSVRLQLYQNVWGSDPAYYLANTPWTLATNNVSSINASGIKLRMATGLLDCMLANHTALHDQMTALGIPHSWTTPAGVDHDALALMDALGPANWEFYRDVFAPLPTGSAFCLGNGSGTPCPCGNTATDGGGCATSLGMGARLRASGSASLSSDSFTLSVYPIPNTSVLFFQGTMQLGNGAGQVFGDGLRCAGGSVIRLGAKQGIENFAQYAPPLDTPISIKGAVPAGGGTRTYQAWFRNPDPTHCTAGTFNLSNGWTVDWTP
jgi:enterochelin esterase-like enzyme